MCKDEMYFREIPIMHKQVVLPQYRGVCSGAYLFCADGKGFVCIVCDNENKKKALIGYEVSSNKLIPLSLYQIKKIIEKLGMESDKESHFEKNINFVLLRKAIEENIDKVSEKGILEIDDTLIFYDMKAIDYTFSVNMTVEQKKYEIREITAALFEDFSCKFFVLKSEIDDNIKRQSLQNEINVMLRINGISFIEKGIIFKIESKDESFVFKMMSYPMYMLGHIVMNNLVFQNIRNPFTIVKYMLESVDVGINGVSLPNDTMLCHTFLVVMAINNLKISGSPFSIGDVRVGEEVNVNSEFTKLLSKQGGNSYTLIWTDQNATNHYEAYSLAKEKIMRVSDMILFFSKSDSIAECFGLGKIVNNWEASRFLSQMSLMDVAYIEDCLDRQAITVSGNEQIEPQIREIDNNEINRIYDTWIEEGYLKCIEDGNLKIESLFNAIRWINKVGSAKYRVDKIIYCVMALEFCLYKEKGTSILEDKLVEYGAEDLSNTKKIANTITVNFDLEKIDDEIKKIIPTLEKDISKYILEKLKEASFYSKLDNMIARLEVPITIQEKDLIKSFRKMRNSLIHGKGMNEATDLNVKKMVGIVSRIITYKLQDLVKDDD